MEFITSQSEGENEAGTRKHWQQIGSFIGACKPELIEMPQGHVGKTKGKQLSISPN
jgi:hypothetical protein